MHCKTKIKNNDMLRIQLHIKTANCRKSPVANSLSPKGDYNNCGACYADE